MKQFLQFGNLALNTNDYKSNMNKQCFDQKTFEPPHNKTYKMACVPSKDSDQPGHPPSPIRVFAVRMKKAWVLSYPLSAQRTMIRLGGCPG